MGSIPSLFHQYEKETVVAVLSLLTGIIVTRLWPLVGDLLKSIGRFLARASGGALRRRAFLNAYCDELIAKHKEFRFAGLHLSQRRPQLDDIFVPIRVHTQNSEVSEAKQRTGNATTLLRRYASKQLHNFVKMGMFSAWGRIRLSSTGVECFDFNRLVWTIVVRIVNFMLGRKRPGSMAQQAIFDLRQLGTYSAILGPGGSGKTALLQYLVLIHARTISGRRKERIQSRRLGLSTKPLIPIYASLSDLAKYVERHGNSSSLLDYVENTLQADLKLLYPENFFRTRLESGRCLVLLDGLDEVFSEVDYRRVRELVQGFIARYPKNRVVLTCRPAGWRDGISSDFAVGEIQPLSLEQVEQFVGNWMRFRCSSRDAHRADAMSDQLVRQIKGDDRLTKLSSTPLLLTILVGVFDSGQHALPLERAILYRRCVETLLERDETKGIDTDNTGIRMAQKFSLLQQLAWAYHSGAIGHHGGGKGARRGDVIQFLKRQVASAGLPEESSSVLVDYFVLRAGLLVHTDIDVMAFSHMSFQEYLTAEYIRSTETVREFLAARDKDKAQWSEVFLVLAGLVADATPLLRAAYRQNPDDLFSSHLNLSCSVLGEAVGVTDKELVRSVLQECLSVYLYPEIKLPLTVPLCLKNYLLQNFTGPVWQYITIRQFMRMGADNRATAFSKFRGMTPSQKSAVLQAADELRLAPGELELVAGLLPDCEGSTLKKVASLLISAGYQPSIQSTSTLVQHAIRQLRADDDDVRALVPLLLKSNTTGANLIDAVKSAVDENITTNLDAAFLLGYLTDEGKIACDNFTHEKGIRDHIEFVEHVCMAAGALAAGRVPPEQLNDLLSVLRGRPKLLKMLSSFVLQLLVFAEHELAVPVLVELLFHRNSRDQAIAALQEIRSEAFGPESSQVLLSLVRKGCGPRRLRDQSAPAYLVGAAALLARIPHVRQADLLEVARFGSAPIVLALVQGIEPRRLFGHLDELRNIIRQRRSHDHLIDSTEWSLVHAISHSVWWEDPTGQAPRLLEDWLFDDRWYIRSEAATAWHRSGRPSMKPAIVAQMHRLLGESTTAVAPERVSPSPPGLAAFAALGIESLSTGFNWPTDAASSDEETCVS